MISLKEKQEKLKMALKRSPVGVAVYAWKLGENGLYIKPEGVQDTHWTLLVNFKEGEYWEIFDSYSPFRKKLAWDYNFGYAKVYYLKKKLLMSRQSESFKRFFPFLRLFSV